MSLEEQAVRITERGRAALHEEESTGYRVVVLFNDLAGAERFIKMLDFFAGFTDEDTIKEMMSGSFTGSYSGTPEAISEESCHG